MSVIFYVIASKKRKYLFLGMEHGQIRVCKLKPENYTDLSDYWILSMHDNFNGYIPKIILSHNQKMLFTCGYDGNLFSYEIKDDTPSEAIEFEIIKGALSLVRICAVSYLLYFKPLLCVNSLCGMHFLFYLDP